MRRIQKSIPLMAVVGLVGVLSAPPAGQAQDAADARLGTIKQYCQGCHNDKAKIGGVSFEGITAASRSEEHTSELQSHVNLVCRLLLEKKKIKNKCNYLVISRFVC